MNDRTKMHPRYWHREGRALAIRTPLSREPLAGHISEENALTMSWAHADALIREGYMLALEKFSSHQTGPEDTFQDILDDLAALAPGESDS